MTSLERDIQEAAECDEGFDIHNIAMISDDHGWCAVHVEQMIREARARIN